MCSTFEIWVEFYGEIIFLLQYPLSFSFKIDQAFKIFNKSENFYYNSICFSSLFSQIFTTNKLCMFKAHWADAQAAKITK